MLPDPISRTEPPPPPPLLLRWSNSGGGGGGSAGAAGSRAAPGWPLGRGRHLCEPVPCRCFLSANFRVCLLLPFFSPCSAPPSLLAHFRGFSPRSSCASICTGLCLLRWEPGRSALGDQPGWGCRWRLARGCRRPSGVIGVIPAAPPSCAQGLGLLTSPQPLSMASYKIPN